MYYLFKNLTVTVPVEEDVNNVFFLLETFVKLDSLSFNSARILPVEDFREIELFAVRLNNEISPVFVSKLILSVDSLGKLFIVIFPSLLDILIFFIVDDDKSISPVLLSIFRLLIPLILFSFMFPVAVFIFRELFSLLKLLILRSPVESLISVSKVETLVK